MSAVFVWLWLAFQVGPELRQHVEAGLAAKRGGDLDTAIREFQRVVELAPGLAAAYVNLGAVYYEKKDYTHAIPALRKALEMNAELPGAHEMLGVALLAQGYAAEAIPHLEKAQADPLLGVALLETGRARDAVDKLETALLKQPGDPDLLYYLGQAHARLSKQAFDQLAATHPESPRTEQLLGEAALAGGNRDGAAKHLQSAIQRRPDLRGVHLALGELYQGSGEYERAEAEFRDEVELSPGSSVAAYKLGAVLSMRGNLHGAIIELQRADALQPEMPETLFELGKALALSGDLGGAEKSLVRVLAQEQTSNLAEAAHFQLAQIYRKLGRSGDAARESKAFQDLRKRRGSGGC